MKSSFRRPSTSRTSFERSVLERCSFGKRALFLLCVVALLISAGAVPQLLAKKKNKASDSGATEQKRAVQALNRLTFGPRPGDIQQVMAMGVDRWIELQLHPEKIPDNDVEARLAPLRTLHMSSKEIVENFPDNPMVKQVMDGKRPMPSDPARRSVYQVQIARLEEKQQQKSERIEQAAAAPANVPVSSGPTASDTAKTEAELAAAAAVSPDPTPGMAADGSVMSTTSMNAASASNGATAKEMSVAPPAAVKPSPAEEAEARRREDRLYADLKVQGLIDLPPDQRYKKVMAMSIDEQVAFADSLRGRKGQDFLAGMDARQKETLMAMNNPQGVVHDELIQAKLLRAIYSDRQLEQVMTDFWFNHFNVFVGKGPERLFLTSYEQDVIRPRALGKFEDLLMATAKSPAMLFYLDNWMSVGPNSMQALGHSGASGSTVRSLRSTSFSAAES